MANPEHLAILKKGAEVWNRWRKHLQSEWFVRTVIGAVITFFITTILGYGCSILKTPLSSVSSFADAIVATAGKPVVQIQPIERQTISHKFLFWGHVHYLTTYQIQIANKGVMPGKLATLQVSSQEGSLLALNVPPLVKPHFPDGTPTSNWSQGLDGKRPKQMVIDFNMPPDGVRVTLVVVIEKTGAFVPDQDLWVHMTCDTVFVRERAAKGRWTDKAKQL